MARDRHAPGFATDCNTVIAAQLENAERQLKNYLPLAPLLRLARRMGIDAIRHVEALSRPHGRSLYQVTANVRQEAVRHRQNREDRTLEILRLEDFGLHVLALEQRGMRRWLALQRAGNKTRLPGSSRRYLETKFHEFEALCRERGFVANRSPRPFPLQFGLADLKARKGRPKKVRTGGPI